MLLVEDVDAIDPHLASAPAAWFVARAVHRGLYRFPPRAGRDGGDPEPDLLASPASIDRGRTRLTMTLREGMTFADGRPVTAADAVASLERIVRGGGGMARWLMVIDGANRFAAGRADSLPGVQAIDERTLRITTRRPVTDLPWVLAHPAVAIVPADTPPAGSTPPVEIVGAGAYRVQRYDPERRLVLTPNERWTDAGDLIRTVDRIEATIGVGLARARSMIAADEADLLLEPGPRDADPLAPAARPGPYPCIRYLFLNQRVAPFDSRDARLAVAAALTDVSLPVLEQAETLLPPALIDERRRPATRRTPAEHLADAGSPEGLASQIVIGDTPEDRRVARAIIDALDPHGIELRMRRVDPALVRSLYYADPSARVPAGIATWCPDWPGQVGRAVLGAIADPRERRRTAPDPVYAGIGGREVVRAIDRAIEAPLDLAQERWAAADRVVRRTGALIPLAFVGERFTWSDRLQGPVGTAVLPRGDPFALWIDP